MALGDNVRRFRLEKGLSLQALAERSGISKSMLSEIENNKKTPSIDIAVRLSRELSINLSDLAGEEAKPRSQFVIQVKENERQVLTDPATGAKALFISPSFNNRGVDFILGVVPPNSSWGFLAPASPDYVKYLYVVQGTLVVRLDGNTYKLAAGDSLCYCTDSEQHISSEGSEECRYYIVVHHHKQ